MIPAGSGAGDLRSRFDVLLLPDASYREMLNGFGAGAMPEEYVGGMTLRGVQNLRTFVERGGTLVAMDRAAELPLAAFSLPALMAIKESVNRAYEVPLSEGLLFERRAFHSTFAFEDQKEGMAAFVGKRPPRFSNT